MSRSFSAAALKALFSPDADESLIVLLTISGGGLPETIRIANGYTGRLSETSETIIYGLTSRNNDYTFIPFEIVLPSESATADPAVSVTLYDVTRQVVPSLRGLTSPPNVTIEIVLPSAPDAVEAAFSGFRMGAFDYDKGQVTADLVVADLSGEPFPQHTFVPSSFPGLF